jgi:uncharacterized protein
MIINVNKISEKGISFNDSVEIDGNSLLEKDGSFLEELNYHILFKREGNRIKAQGRIRTRISLPCVKCLEYFDLKINSRFDIILFPLELLDQKNTALEAEDMEYIFYEEDQIDLTKILVEQINLFIPMHPQCHPGCRGICPNCGSNLNAATCQCEKPRNEIKFFFEKIKR